MDKLERYREIVRRLIEEYASYKPANGKSKPRPSWTTNAIITR